MDGPPDPTRAASEAWAKLGSALFEKARQDPDFHKAIIDLLDQLRSAVDQSLRQHAGAEPESQQPESPSAAVQAPEPLPPLTLGSAIRGPTVVDYDPPQPYLPEQREVRLGLVVRRATLKSEAARWAITRRQRLDEYADFETAVKPSDTSLIERAKELDECYLWMLDPYQSLPDDDLLEVIAGCYEAVATAAEMARDLLEVEDVPLRDLLMLVAEAQSALRKALEDADFRNDADQMDVFNWLRNQTQVLGIYIPRYMMLDDSADPSQYVQTQQRLGELRRRVQERQNLEGKRKALLNTIRYEIKQLRADDADRAAHHWGRVNASIEEWEQAPFPLTRRELIDLLVQIADDLSDDIELTPAARRAFAAVDQFLSDRESRSQPPEPSSRALPDEVARAAELVRGKVVLLIGGEQRLHAKRNIERDLELRELRWVSTSSHQPLDLLVTEITRQDVDLVMLAIRWTSHSFGEMKSVCDEYGKPFIRLPAGYGVNQVARQILMQISDQLT